MTRPIRWDVIENNHDQIIKYATAIRVGTASTEAILRRFTRTTSHPVYQAMLEVGRGQKTILVARYLRDRDLQREIQEGVNTLIIQSMLAEPEWAGVLTDEDRRALTPLFWMPIQPSGEVRLNMSSRLHLSAPSQESEPAAA